MAIDITTETVITPAKATGFCPERRRGVLQGPRQSHRIGSDHGAPDLVDGKRRPAVLASATEIPDREFKRCVPCRNNAAGFDVGSEIGREGLALHPGVDVIRIWAVGEAIHAGRGVRGVVVQARFFQVYLGKTFKICAKRDHRGSF